LLNVAICAHSGEIDFFIYRTKYTSVEAGAFIYVALFTNPEHWETVRIPCNSLWHYVEGRIDLLKCDIEAAEYRVRLTNCSTRPRSHNWL
jgi:hypothetical protein